MDVGATGTVTAGEVTTNQINSPNSFISFQPSSFERLQITTGDLRPNSFGDYDLGRSTNTFNDCYLHGTLNTVDVDATGTVTAGDIAATNSISIPAFKLLSFGSSSYSITKGTTSLQMKSWDAPVHFAGSAGTVMSVGTNTGVVDVTGDIDATGTVKKGVYTVATLPTGEAGMTCFVSDANATTRGSTVAGGGANFMPVYSDGTNWIIS